MDGQDDEEYITNRHNPDLSEEKWDNRWEKAKQQKQKARADECKKLLDAVPEYERERLRQLAEDDARKRRHQKEGTRKDDRWKDEKFRRNRDSESSSRNDRSERRAKRQRSEEKEGSNKAIIDLRTNKQRMLDLQEEEQTKKQLDEPINPKLGA